MYGVLCCLRNVGNYSCDESSKDSHKSCVYTRVVPSAAPFLRNVSVAKVNGADQSHLDKVNEAFQCSKQKWDDS